jgi:hypothetical protein
VSLALPVTPPARPSEENLLEQLLHQWAAKQPRNLLRASYYNGTQELQDFGIAIPPSMKRFETVLGWPAKAVDGLARRCQFDGFVLPGTAQDPYDITGVLVDNHMDVEIPQVVVSALTHSVAFMSVTQGDTAAGEPEVLILSRSALHATGLWDRRRRALRAALAVFDSSEGTPTGLILYEPDRVTTYTHTGSRWVTDVRRNPLGRVPVEPIVYRPDLLRPLGHSRISRAVMSLTDSALRTVLRSEVSAEFYSSPQRYVLGADAGAFGGQSRWDIVLGRILAIQRDEDGNVPEVGQYPSASMQPHMDQLRGWAQLFAGETSLPLASLGIAPESNPSSAEAIYAAKEDLVVEAEAAARVFGAGLSRVARTAVMLRDGMDSEPDDLRRVQARWRNPSTPSVVSASDALVKQAAVMPWLADSEVSLELLGYDQPTITRLLADRRRSQARDTVAALAAAARGVTPSADQS